MATLKEATTPRDISNLDLVIKPAQPLSSPPVTRPSLPGYNSLSLAAVPDILGTSPDWQRTFYRGGTSQSRFSPLPAAAALAANAASTGIATTIVTEAISKIPAQVPGTIALEFFGGNNLLGGLIPVLVTGSPITDPPGGTFVETLVSQIPGFVAAGSPYAFDQMSFSQGTGSTMSPGQIELTTSTINPSWGSGLGGTTPSADQQQLLLAAFMWTNASDTITSISSGWTLDGTATNTYTGSYGIQGAHQTVEPNVASRFQNPVASLSGSATWASVVIGFRSEDVNSGPVESSAPVILQSATTPSGGSGSYVYQNVTMGSATTAGSFIVVIVGAQSAYVYGNDNYIEEPRIGLQNGVHTVITPIFSAGRNKDFNATGFAVFYIPSCPSITGVFIGNGVGGLTYIGAVVYELQSLSTLIFNQTGFRQLNPWDMPPGAPSTATGVNAQTGSYIAGSADNGKLISINDASASTLTLPNPPIIFLPYYDQYYPGSGPISHQSFSRNWNCFVQNTGLGTVTLTAGSTTQIDGSVSGIALLPNQGLSVATDGVNYFTQRGGAGGSSSFTNPMTTLGDTIYGGLSGVPTRLPVGTSAQVLTISGGIPSWQNAAAGFVNPMTTKGDIIIENATPAPDRLPIGATGQVLTVVAGLPAWGAGAGGSASPYSRRWGMYASGGTTIGSAGTLLGVDTFTLNGSVSGIPVLSSPSFTTPTSKYTSSTSGTCAGGIENGFSWVTGNNILYQARVAIGSLVTQRVRIGITDSTTAQAFVNGDTLASHYAAFRFSTAASDANWQCQTANGSSNTTVDSGVPVVANTLYYFQIQFNDSVPNIIFSINKVVVATISTNIPTGSVGLRMSTAVDPLASVSTSVYIAWIYTEADS